MPFTHFVFISFPSRGYHSCFCVPDVWKGTVAFQKCNRCDREGAEFMGKGDGSVRLRDESKPWKRT
jgi:hypothetical protein